MPRTKGKPIEPFGRNLYTKDPRTMQKKGQLHSLSNGKPKKKNRKN